MKPSLKTILAISVALQFCFNICSQTGLNSVSQRTFWQNKFENLNKIKAVLSFGAGVAYLTTKSSAPFNDFDPKSSFQLSALVPLGKWAGLRLDMGYSNWQRDAYEESDQVITNSYGARKRDCFYLKPDFVAGDFTSTNKF